MSLRTVRWTLLVPLLSILWAVAAPQGALSQTCCSNELPTSESTQYSTSYNNGTYFGGLYEQTLSGPAGYDGSTMEEIPGTDTGENTCYFPGDLPGQHPKIFGPAGSYWTVNVNNQWGPDFVGMFNLDAQQIWQMYEDGTMSLPCYEITYQNMKIFCNQQTYNYDSTQNVVQTREMNANYTITVEREGIPSPQIAVPQ